MCVWGESHGSSATASLRDSRHVQMVFVLVPNEVPDTESRDLIGHIDLRVLVGEKLSSPAMFGHLQMYEPVEKCEEVASWNVVNCGNTAASSFFLSLMKEILWTTIYINFSCVQHI